MMNQWTSIIEGLLFMIGDEGLTIEQLMQVLECDEEAVVYCLEEISQSCEAENRGIQLTCLGNHYKFVTKANVHEYGVRLFELPERNKLSQAALETLAIIAYKQPITRSEIEEIRGVGCDIMIRKLIAKALVKEVGRSETVGRPALYAVTEEFMDAFNLKSMNELPDLPSLDQDSEMTLFDSID
ncbi:MAG: SMC-Scp complex subunit ScpB [Erysipelotrichaceae bacterium]|nr:SMC-Scp complex subunit ScpB [Erysipelotrichaceae bacterium]